MQAATLNRVASGAIAMTAETAERLAGYFRVRAGWLLFGEGEAPAGLAEAYAAGFRDALDTAKAALEARALAIATGKAGPIGGEGAAAPPRTPEERVAADLKAIDDLPPAPPPDEE